MHRLVRCGWAASSLKNAKRNKIAGGTNESKQVDYRSGRRRVGQPTFGNTSRRKGQPGNVGAVLDNDKRVCERFSVVGAGDRQRQPADVLIRWASQGRRLQPRRRQAGYRTPAGRRTVVSRLQVRRSVRA